VSKESNEKYPYYEKEYYGTIFKIHPVATNIVVIHNI